MDRRSSEELGIPIRMLMERAGLAVFNEIRELLPEGARITFLCGKGNNGGDGFVAARLSHLNGFHVDCLVAFDEAELGQEPRDQMVAAKEVGVPIFFANDKGYRRRIECLGCRDLAVDALLGTGAKGEVRGPVVQAIQAINRSGTPVLSIDVPSGIDCDTGEELGESVWAAKTVTLGLPKPFLFQGTGLEHCGVWSVADLGFPASLLREPTDARLVDCEWVASMVPERLKSSHKGDNGHVLIVAGSQKMPGAAVMAARSAIRSGAGLVTVASIPAVCQIVASHVPECIFLPLPELRGEVDRGAADVIEESVERYDAALFGPGLTHSDQLLGFLGEVWANWKLPSLIDADALNAVALGVPLPSSECVLTPHPGEMSRLLEASVAEIQADRFATVRQAIEKFGRCILLKGPHTIVGEQGNPMAVNSSGNPGLASGGMGDVLGGLISTLLAQSVPAYYAASSGMYWHGLAGDFCAKEIGPVGYSAIDVANALPKARAKIVASCNYESCCSS
ncbi:MAG: NAD(P)H-hydrate dehydratase [Chlorobia bacterium]|nr:NAD(P)H-hydrate dehydratase [Fimbriimonadaceae bacterium]